MSGKYNYLGIQISGIRKLKEASFGKKDTFGNQIHNDYGECIPNWVAPSEFVDENGFDKSYIGTHGFWDEIILEPGTVIVRYGNEIGRLTTNKGTDYEKLGLPYIQETCEYHEYIVLGDGVKVKCRVNRGLVYKMFDSPGGAIQYLHSQSIKRELYTQKLKEVFSWKEEMKSV